MDASALALVRDLLVGARCSEVGLNQGFLEIVLGKHRLVVYCAWRIIGGGLLAGSGESGSGRVEDALKFRQISAVNVHGPFHDLQIEFEDGAILETFADSAQHESWNIVGEEEHVLVAGPGQQWARF
jgi:hypothetical protein